MEHVSEQLEDSEYISRHKTTTEAFSRTRKLPFSTVFILILRNSVKSLQLILNEFILDMDMRFSITAGAFTKARKKLKHTAYTELNDGIIDIYYRDNDIKRLRGYRILAFDGSSITLPNNKRIKEEFGSVPIINNSKKDLGEYVKGNFQSCYDVLNNIAVKSTFGHGLTYEVDIAGQMLSSLRADDLLIFDRGYASYLFMANLIKQQRPFIIRCPKMFFSAVRHMYAAGETSSQTVNIPMPDSQKKKVAKLGLADTIKIKLVSVILSSGEVEVLATSLLDEDEFTIEDFSYLYSLRWGIETFFSKIKGRLGLENFTGKTIESVYQDFWSTIFISNFETILTEDAEEEMNISKEDKKLKINKAVSFNAIKNMAFEIFFTEPDKEKVCDKLTKLFVMNPVTVRKKRLVPRKTTSDARSLNFQKRIRKHVF